MLELIAVLGWGVAFTVCLVAHGERQHSRVVEKKYLSLIRRVARVEKALQEDD